MNWANYTIIVWYILAVGISLGQHGKTEEKTENAWTSLISVSLFMILLYYGGFFR